MKAHSLTAEEILRHIEDAYRFYRDMYYMGDEKDRETYAHAAETLSGLLDTLEHLADMKVQ